MKSFFAVVKIYIFRPKTKKGFEKRIPSERASPEEQNGPSFSFVAPYSEEF